jgi:hypothetical protein
MAQPYSQKKEHCGGLHNVQAGPWRMRGRDQKEG